MHMMRTLLKIFDVSMYRTRVEQDSATLVYTITSVLLIIQVIFMLTVRQWTIPGVTDSALLIETIGYRADTLLYMFVPTVVAVITFLLIQQGQLRIASWGPSIMFFALAVLPVFISETRQFDRSADAVSLMLLLVITIMLNRLAGLIIGLPLALLMLALRPGMLDAIGTYSTLLFQLVGTGLVMYLFVRLAPVSREEEETNATRERLKLAEINSRITREASRRLPLSEILDLALSLILENYPSLYHAQVFLLNDRGTSAKLHASTGETGKQLLAQDHMLSVGSMSVIGQVTLNGNRVIEEANPDNPMYRHNPLLPDTRIEAAFPLFAGDKIIGALDLHSKLSDSFLEEDLPGFQSIADSLSLVLDNVRQFEAAQQRIEENRYLAEQARDALRDIERLNQRLVGQAWSEYLRRQDRPIGLTFNPGR